MVAWPDNAGMSETDDSIAQALAVLAEERLSDAGQAALAVLRRRLLGPAPPDLTPRQREVARLVARGLTNREIAMLLGLKEGTAKLHVAAVLGRLGVARREEVAARLNQG